MPDPFLSTAAGAREANTADAPRRDNDVLLACGLAGSAGLIHVQAAVDHISEYWLYTLLFIVLACAQFAWTVALYRSPQRILLVSGLIASLGVVAIWILSRTLGLPLGAEGGGPEPVGLLDTVASANEIALVVLVAFKLRPPRIRKLGDVVRPALRAVIVALILLSSLALAGGVHAH